MILRHLAGKDPSEEEELQLSHLAVRATQWQLPLHSPGTGKMICEFSIFCRYNTCCSPYVLITLLSLLSPTNTHLHISSERDFQHTSTCTIITIWNVKLLHLSKKANNVLKATHGIIHIKNVLWIPSPFFH